MIFQPLIKIIQLLKQKLVEYNGQYAASGCSHYQRSNGEAEVQAFVKDWSYHFHCDATDNHAHLLYMTRGLPTPRFRLFTIPQHLTSRSNFIYLRFSNLHYSLR